MVCGYAASDQICSFTSANGERMLNLLELYTIKREAMRKKGLKLRNSWGRGLQWDKLHIYLRVGPLVLFQLDTDWSNRRFTLAVLNFKITNK